MRILSFDHNFFDTGDDMIGQQNIKRSMVRLSGAMLMSLFMLAAAPVSAEQTNKDKEWSDWKALDRGFVAQRRVPPKLDKQVDERGQEKVQERLLKLEQLRDRIASTNLTSKKKAALERRLAKLEGRVDQLKKKSDRALLREQRDTQNGLWLRTGMAGLYAVSVDELSDILGQSTRKIQKNIQRGQLAMSNGGKPVSWHYDRSTNSVLFAGERYETFYTDQNAYYFQLGRTRTKSMPVIDGRPSGASVNHAPFMDSLHFEEEPDLLYSTWTVAAEQDADYWFWDYLYGGYKDSIDVSLTVPDPAQTGTAHLRVTLRGWTDLDANDEHRVYAELNGHSIGTMVIWDGFTEAELAAQFDQSLLNADGNNTLVLRNSYTPGSHPGQWLDQIEIDYSRMPVAVNDALWLHNVEGGAQTVSGLSDENILVIESPADSAAILENVKVEADENGQWTVSFNAETGQNYLVVTQDSIHTPLITADNASDLENKANRAEYLIIAPRDFSGTAEALAEFHRTHFNDVKVVWLDDIYNEFSYGRVDPYAVGRFMEQVARWRVSPANVVLLGKGSLDEKNRMGYSDSFVPVLMTATPWALTASDERLLGAEENRSFAVGRIPITNDSEGIAYVDKLIAHKASLAGNAPEQAVLFADDPDKAGNFHHNSDLLADRLLTDLDFSEITRLYQPDNTVRETMILSDTWETGYVNYYGHGSVAQVGNYKERYITTKDADALNNSVFPIFTALSCAVGNFTVPGTRSLAGSLLLNPSGGAIASMAPSGLSLDSEAEILGTAFVDNLFGQLNSIGEAVRQAKIQTGDRLSPFMLRMYSVIGDPAVKVGY
ncbi:Peptidase family C25 [Candidatus Electrothrix marina]|uniref:Peptidase family C25 n=1 Tax=Candidatus Electrothrix marina TaxID=1859130 RepID=A0A444JH53_9BACT|nr:Peptidase family C25 [Candidatus Electrothrix marina]